ncbi:hypothetical protein PMIN05_011382 [Paraphaeosphaeria minitans]
MASRYDAHHFVLHANITIHTWAFCEYRVGSQSTFGIPAPLTKLYIIIIQYDKGFTLPPKKPPLKTDQIPYYIPPARPLCLKGYSSAPARKPIVIFQAPTGGTLSSIQKTSQHHQSSCLFASLPPPSAPSLGSTAHPP